MNPESIDRLMRDRTDQNDRHQGDRQVEENLSSERERPLLSILSKVPISDGGQGQPEGDIPDGA